MTTVTKLGPADHGRVMTYEEFLHSASQEGYHYELIGGKLHVSPMPNLPSNHVEDWVQEKLKEYARHHPDVVNHVTNKARVFVPGAAEVTAPEPDVAVYRDLSAEQRLRLRWEDVSPVLVVEILSEEDPEKDLERNRDLYLLVPSIREYWVLDPRLSGASPTMRVHVRRGRRWQPRDLAAGATYTTRLLPGFSLVLDTLR